MQKLSDCNTIIKNRIWFNLEFILIGKHMQRREGMFVNKNDYKPRLIDRTIDEFLETFGAICIEGTKVD